MVTRYYRRINALSSSFMYRKDHAILRRTSAPSLRRQISRAPPWTVILTCGWLDRQDSHICRRTCIGCLILMLCNNREPRHVNVLNSDARFKIFCLGRPTRRRCRLQSSMGSFVQDRRSEPSLRTRQATQAMIPCWTPRLDQWDQFIFSPIDTRLPSEKSGLSEGRSSAEAIAVPASSDAAHQGKVASESTSSCRSPRTLLCCRL